MGVGSFLFYMIVAGWGGAHAGEVHTLDTFHDRMGVIEAQVGLACDSKGLETHELKTQMADRLISKEGPISRIQRDLGAAVHVVGSELEYARERVADRYRQAHAGKMEAQLLKVEGARLRLKREGEGAREAVRSEYSRYLELKGQDPVAAAYSQPETKERFRNEVAEVLRVRKKEMQELLSLGSRADSARMKAAMCYCRGHDSPSDDRCPDDLESVKKKTEYVQAVSNFDKLRGTLHKNDEAK